MSDKVSKYYYKFLVAFLVLLSLLLIVAGYHYLLGQTYIAGIFLGIAVLGVMFPALAFIIGGSWYMHVKAYARVKEKEQKRSKAIIKEREKLGEKVLGSIRALRREYIGEIHEVLVFTSNRVIVEKIAEIGPGSGYGGPPAINWSDVRIDLPKSEIIKVELNKFFKAVKLDIITSEERYKWYARGLIPEKKGKKLEDYQNILQQAFPNNLSVKK